MAAFGARPALFLMALPSAATLFGGSLALRFRGRLQRLIGLSSGAIVGVALFDLLPEAFGLGRAAPPLALTTAAALGFGAYLALHAGLEALEADAGGLRAAVGPLSLCVHSLIDGLSIGLGFQASASAGAVVAVAVVAHDLFDGANTVALSLSAGGRGRAAARWLWADAAAPLLGFGLSRTLRLDASALALLLAACAGVFLYIGAVELLPRRREGGAPVLHAAGFALGSAAIYLIVRAAGG